jgi:hypothetical protein
MSKILKRPMFRIGGSANDGVMSMAAPRRNYQEGSPREERVTRSAEEYARLLEKFAGPGPSVSSDLGDLLISGGLNLMSGRGAGRGNLGAIAEAYRDPYAAFSKARANEEALKRQLRMSAATQAISSDEAERLARLKIKAGYEAQTTEAQVKEYAASLKDYEIPAIKNRRGDIAEKVVQFRTNNPGTNFVGMPNIEETQKQNAQGQSITVRGYNLATIPEGAVFFDPIEFQFKKRITKGIDPKTNKPILGEIYVDIQGKEKTQQNLKNENVVPVSNVKPEETQKKGTVNPYKTYRLG